MLDLTIVRRLANPGATSLSAVADAAAHERPRIRLARGSDLSAASLVGFVRKRAQPDASVHTDTRAAHPADRVRAIEP